jgi:hypothetical protein
LQRRADELFKQADQLHQQGKYPDATKLLKQTLALFRQLYPLSSYLFGG